MKILFINTVCGKGSTGRIASQIGAAAEQAGGSYMVAYGRGVDGDPEHSYRIGGKWHTYVHAFLSRITDRAGFYSKAATKQLVKFIRAYHPDAIHLHNLHGYYLNIEILFDYLKNEYKGKVVWTLHDCWAFTGHCVHYTCAGCDRWKTGCHHCPEKGEYPASVLADQVVEIPVPYAFRHPTPERAQKRGAWGEEHHFFIVRVPDDMELNFCENRSEEISVAWVAPDDLLNPQITPFDDMREFYATHLLPNLDCKFSMSLRPEYYEMVGSGEKDIELRLYDDKRRKMRYTEFAV